jgi:hypothetical protein
MNGHGPALLALDYPGRRDDSRITDLFDGGLDYDVSYLLEWPPVEATADHYVRRLAEGLDPPRPRPSRRCWATAWCRHRK